MVTEHVSRIIVRYKGEVGETWVENVWSMIQLRMVDSQHEYHEVCDHGVQMKTDKSLHEHHSELQAGCPML